MQSTEVVKPTAIKTPIAVNGNKNIPPQNATGTDTSSINLGFLPITSEPLDDGGQAPERIDFNGMFYLSTDQRVFLQNGGFITYDADVATSIGGYPQGAVLGYLDNSDNFCYVESLIDNNQYNFVTTPSYINGTYWKYVAGKPKTISILEQIFPIGAIFIGTTATCPLSIFFGTWELVAADRCLQGSSSNHEANTTIPAAIPNIKGSITRGTSSSTAGFLLSASGAFSLASKASLTMNTATNNNYYRTANFDASSANSMYSDSASTLQVSAYVVNVWRRTA